MTVLCGIILSVVINICARSPVDRTVASEAASVGSTPAERTRNYPASLWGRFFLLDGVANMKAIKMRKINKAGFPFYEGSKYDILELIRNKVL